MADTFCPLPYVHQLVNINGSVRPCCMARIDNDKELQEWNQVDFKDGLVTLKHIATRKTMNEGKWPKCCKICRTQEKQGVKSFRKVALENYGDYNRHSLDVQYLDIKFTNTCNLACRMCKPSDSSKLEKLYKEHKPAFIGQGIVLPTYDPEEKVAYTKKLIKNGLKVLKVTGGEPLACKYFMEVVDWCVKEDYAKNLIIGFTTNATTINKKLLSKLENFKQVKIVISIDGTDKIYEYIRQGASWEQTKVNIKLLATYASDKFIIQASCVLQFYNMCNIETLYDFIAENNIPFKIDTDIKPTGSELDVRNADSNCLAILERTGQRLLVKEYEVYNDDAKENAKKILNIIQQKFEPRPQELLNTTIMQDKLMNKKYKDYLHTEQVKFLESL